MSNNINSLSYKCRSCKIDKQVIHYIQKNNKGDNILISICNDCYNNVKHTCPKCNVDKEYNKYGFNKQKVSGLHYYCKECSYINPHLEYNKDRYSKYKEYYKEYYKNYNLKKNKNI